MGGGACVWLAGRLLEQEERVMHLVPTYLLVRTLARTPRQSEEQAALLAACSYF